jgi:ABC-type branched-subunit amino acid transport system substrate-binding protein
MSAAALLLLASLALAGGGPPSVVRKASMADSPAAAAAVLEEALPGAPAADQAWIVLYAAEYRRLAGDLAAAREGFQKIAADYPSEPAREPAKVGLAVIDSGGGLAGSAAGGNALATLELIAESGVPGSLNADRWLLVAQARLARGDTGPAREAMRRAEASARGTFAQKRVSAAIAALKGKPSSDAPAPVKDDRPADLVAIEAIRADLAAARFTDVQSKAATFPEKFPDSPFVREAAYALRRGEKGIVPDRGLIGVVLPLTGEYALPAGQVRDAIKLAAEVLGGPKVVVFDTAGSPEGCSQGVEKLVIDQGAALLLGPLTKEEALGCAPTAQALHVPMLTFSSADEVLAAGDQVFRPFPSVNEQIGVLLDELMGRRGWGRFAVVNPNTSFGMSAGRSFGAQVEARGGKIAATHEYDAAAKDFRSVGKVLGKKDYKARQAEYWQAQAALKRAGGDPSKATLRPTIDYDAIFVPDGYQRAALLASALAFEEFPIGGFRPHPDDMPLGLVGLNAWNNPEWARRGGDYVRDSIFVDAFWAGSENPDVRSFVSRWRERGKGDPSVVEAVGWDSFRVAAAGLAATGADMAANLLSLELPAGVSGLHGFTAERTGRREWTLLTVGAGGVGPLYPSEAPTPAPQ